MIYTIYCERPHKGSWIPESTMWCKSSCAFSRPLVDIFGVMELISTSCRLPHYRNAVSGSQNSALDWQHRPTAGSWQHTVTTGSRLWRIVTAPWQHGVNLIKHFGPGIQDCFNCLFASQRTSLHSSVGGHFRWPCKFRLGLDH